MKVAIRTNNGDTVNGILVSKLNGVTTFIPNNDPYGDERMTIENSRIGISEGEEDSDCILVSGYKKVGELYSNVCLVFRIIK